MADLARRKGRYIGTPSLKGVNISEQTPLGREIKAFTEAYTRDQFLTIKTEADGSGKRLTVPAGLVGRAGDKERGLMAALGWYWEPLLHDIAFLEQMRDSIALLSGAYQKFTDLVMDGLAFQHPDPEAKEELEDIFFNDPTCDFREVVRSCVFELVSISNFYRKPIFTTDEQGFRVKTFRPIRVTAMRKLRDENLITEGYVQLLHRPSEFLWGATAPMTPTIHLADEIICGQQYTRDWYAYGVPALASLPFVIKQKLQMEKDLVEMLHQHVPRIDITYTPEEQMNQDQVDTNVAKVKQMVGALQPTDSIVHTPDTEMEYKGPLGKALDQTAPHNNVEEQIFYVLPLGPGLLGRDVAINPIYSNQIWRLTTSLVTRVRERIEFSFRPAIKRVCEERGIVGLPSWGWTSLDAETDEIKARTNEYNIQNAAAQRDNGFVDQDAAAKAATSHHPSGPVDKAAEPGPIPPPTDPNKIDPKTNKPYPSGPAGPVSKSGPKGPNRSAPTPDKRQKGKRHEAIESMANALNDIFEFADIRLGVVVSEETT